MGDVANPDDLARALDGMDTAVHLAATPDEADFLTRLLPNNVVGLYHVLEAARHARLARLVLVSSGQLYRGHDGPLPITPATPTSPRNWYALTKVLTEAAGQVYAARPRPQRGGDPPRLGAPRPRARRRAGGERPREGQLSESGRRRARLRRRCRGGGTAALHGRARHQPAGRGDPLRSRPGAERCSATSRATGGPRDSTWIPRATPLPEPPRDRDERRPGRRRAPEGRGRAARLRDRRLDLPRRAGRPPRRQERGVRERPSRAGRRLHGRRPRAGHRHAGRVPGDERTRRDEPRDRHRRGPRGALARGGDRRRLRRSAWTGGTRSRSSTWWRSSGR